MQPKRSIDTIPESGSYWDHMTQRLVGVIPKQKMRPIDIYPDGSVEVRLFNKFEVCQGTHSVSYSCHGDILHCTDVSYDFNYGKVGEKDLLRAWHERNLGKIGHPACLACNVRCVDHDERLKRFLGVK